VNAYKDDGHTAVTLLQGVVRVAFSGSSVIIKPGQQAVATDDVHIIKNPDLESVMAWKNGEFVMKSADIHSIMRQVARWYDVDVVYEGGIPAARISGEVSRNLNLAQILQVLKYSGIQVKVDGRRVIVAP
jgi:ferric-dicitrate binding protein FerR (iron transport regulator)